MSLRQQLAAFGAAAAIAGVGFHALGPHEQQTGQEIDQQRQEQQVDNLSHSNENEKERMRQSGNDLVDGDLRDELRPVEVRPAEHLPLRIP